MPFYCRTREAIRTSSKNHSITDGKDGWMLLTRPFPLLFLLVPRIELRGVVQQLSVIISAELQCIADWWWRISEEAEIWIGKSGRAFPALKLSSTAWRAGVVCEGLSSLFSCRVVFSSEEVEWGTGGSRTNHRSWVGMQLEDFETLKQFNYLYDDDAFKINFHGNKCPFARLSPTHSLFSLKNLWVEGRGPVRRMDADSCQKMFVIELSTFFADNTKTVLSFTLPVQHFLLLFL